MNLFVNARASDISAQTLEDALKELGFTSPAIATALNGCFIAREDRSATRLHDGDRLEVLAPMQGG